MGSGQPESNKEQIMSRTRYKYYKVTTTQIVRAPNKTEALDKVKRRPGVEAEVLEKGWEAERIPAVEAKSISLG